MATTTKSTTVSAPGKILLAGGYLVLESPNVGVVLAVDKKFYSTVVQRPKTTTTTTKEDEEPDTKKPKVANVTTSLEIKVHSPQFDATWYYLANTTRGTSGSTTTKIMANELNPSSNSFVEKTLRVSMAYLYASTATPFGSDDNINLDITILADNDFYSVTPHLQARKWDATPEKLAQLPKFLPCITADNGSLQKTGLGSSAALVTSLVGALVLSATNATQMDDALRRRIHNLAQICHCHAQGKVGSGFDVSSASFGSHVYQRFPKCLLSDLLQDFDKTTSDKGMSDKTATLLQHLVEESPENYKWPGGVQTALSWNTDLLNIMLADVSGGSESPSMARKILSWKATSDDISCWTNLATLNQGVVGICEDIVRALPANATTTSIAEMTKVLSQYKLDAGNGEEWIHKSKSNSNGNDDDKVDEATQNVGNHLCRLRKTLLETRRNLKQMGELSSVPVEPEEQTQLADATMELPGVVASLVPGAGGYDALVVVYVNTPDVRDKICNLWTNYKPLAVCPLAVQFAPYGDGLQYEAEVPEYNHDK